MAMSFSAEKGTPFIAFVRAMRRSGIKPPLFYCVTAVSMGGDLGSGGINGVGLTGMLFLAIDHSGGATNNNIYMLASVIPPGS